MHHGALVAVAMLGLWGLVAGCGTNSGSNQASSPAPSTTSRSTSTAPVQFANASYFSSHATRYTLYLSR